MSLWAYRTDLAPREAINGFADGRFDVAEAINQNDEILGTNAMETRKFSHCFSYQLDLHADGSVKRASFDQPRKKSTPWGLNLGRHGIETSRMQRIDL